MPDESQIENKKVLVGMSGGLDSTMSVFLLKNAGYHVIGTTLKTWHLDPETTCHTVAKAGNLAAQLNIDHHVVDVEELFKNEVVQYFCSEYQNGKTPNPCNHCNPKVKWPALIKKADELGCQYIATGHYVQKKKSANRWFVKKGVDSTKDQSYFLCTLDQQILERALFPLGELTKNQVRQMAIEIGLTQTAEQKESMGVCFLGKTNYRDFLKKEAEDGKINIEPGTIIDEDGRILGKHQGIAFFTIGQKRELNLKEDGYFVTRLDSKNNQVVVSKNASLKTNKLFLSDFCLTEDLPTSHSTDVLIKIRGFDNIPETSGKIIRKNGLEVLFDKPAWGITPGQSIVFYKNNCIIGRGIV